jgi:hypothetical protein
VLSDQGFRRALRRGSTTLVLAGCLVATVGLSTPVWAAPPITPPADGPSETDTPEQPYEPAPLTPAQEAGRQAQATGQRVEVVAERAEDELVFANPDGTYTSEITAGPQRVAQPDGSWLGVDPTLERRPDGSIGPKVAAVDVTFARGGTRDLVRLGENGKEMILGWPKPLPEPVLEDGPKPTYVTYPEVIPGVDLRMRASSVGYSYVMVVKTAQAATSSELAQLKLSVRGVGVEVRENAGGGLEAVDGTGVTLFSGSQPNMWDSTRPPKPPKDTTPPSQPDSEGNPPTTPTTPPAPVEGPTPADVSKSPTASSQVADVGLTIAGTALTLVPDAEMLRNKDTVFPVYIDPNATVKKTDWLYVSSDHPSTEYHNFDDDKGVGRCSNWGGYLCDSNPFTNRMYFKFVPVEKDWNERVVTKAVFRAYETWSFSCTESWVNLNLVDASRVNSGTNWNNKPADGDLMVDRKVAYGRGKSCDPDAPASWVEFADNKEETNENLTSTVKSKLASGSPIAFSLNAKDEGDGNSWKRFKGDNASLVVTYNTLPGKPFNERLTDPNKACVTGDAARPYVWNDVPNMVASAQDADSQNISITFHLTDVTTNKVVQTTKVGPKAHTDSNKKAVDYKAPITAANFVHGHKYKWNARSNDGAYNSLSFSDWCEHAVDKERPNTVPAVTSTDFPTDQANKKPGEFGSVTFSANGNKDSAWGNDVAYYEWAVGNDNPTNKTYPTAIGGDAVESKIAAVAFGPNVLYVRSVDRAGNRSDVTRYVFRAVRPCEDPATDTCAAAAYLLDETTGTTAADASGKGRTLTLTGVDRVDGQRVPAGETTDKALRFAGGTDVATAAPVVDTRNGFTVMAWVKPSSLTADATIVSQVGTNGNGFALTYSAALKKWTFTRHTSDKAGLAAGDVVQAVNGDIDPPVAGVWTHVVGMFNPGNNRMSIYVDGKEQGTADYVGTVWNAAGSLQLGRSRLNDKWVAPFSGDIDDVRIFPGGLDPADVDDLWRKSKP